MKRKIEKIIITTLNKGWLVELVLDNKKCKRFACQYTYEFYNFISEPEYEDDSDDAIPF